MKPGQSFRILVALPLPVPKQFKKGSQTSSSVIKDAVYLFMRLRGLSAFVLGVYKNSTRIIPARIPQELSRNARISSLSQKRAITTKDRSDR